MSLSFLLLLALVALLTGPGPVWACVVLSVAILALIGFLEWLGRDRAPGFLESPGFLEWLDRDPH